MAQYAPSDRELRRREELRCIRQELREFLRKGLKRMLGPMIRATACEKRDDAIAVWLPRARDIQTELAFELFFQHRPLQNQERYYTRLSRKTEKLARRVAFAYCVRYAEVEPTHKDLTEWANTLNFMIQRQLLINIPLNSNVAIAERSHEEAPYQAAGVE